MTEEQNKSKNTNNRSIEIEVSNFGPITQGKVCTKPLTIFTGPSNTGKSYLAKLLYSVLKTPTDHIDPSNISRSDKEPLNLSIKDKLLFNDSFIKEDKFQKYLITNNIDDLLTDQSLFDRILKECLDHQQVKSFLIKYFLIYTRRFNKQVNLCLGPLFKLVKIGQSNLNILLNDMMYFHQKDDHQQTCLRVTQKPFETFIESRTEEICNHICTDLFLKMSNNQNVDEEVFLKKMNQSISDFCCDYGKSYLPVHSNIDYFPAARTGLIQKHRLIAASAIRNLASTRKASKLSSGEIVDFLDKLITIDIDQEKPKELLEIAGEIETNILKGQVEVVFDETNYPDFIFKQDGRSFYMLSASSMVTELAPIVIFFKYGLVNSGDTLIIDEPEAHLHPRAQKDMAKILVALVKAGVNIIITTHSNTLVRQISNYRMGAFAPEKKRKEIMKDSLSLNEDELVVYSFKKDKKDVTIEEIPFSSKDGISIEDHNDVSTELYDETINIYDESRRDESKSSA